MSMYGVLKQCPAPDIEDVCAGLQVQQAAVDLEAPIKAVPAEGHEHCRVAQPERQRQRDERLARRHRGGSHRDAAGEDPR